MFELSDSLIDDIAFAMEDQAKGSLVDISTGAVLPRGPETEGDGFAEPPVWSSREGYQLMIRLPLNRANELVQIEKARKLLEGARTEDEEIREIARLLNMEEVASYSKQLVERFF